VTHNALNQGGGGGGGLYQQGSPYISHGGGKIDQLLRGGGGGGLNMYTNSPYGGRGSPGMQSMGGNDRMGMGGSAGSSPYMQQVRPEVSVKTLGAKNTHT
jgi:hypothetical protein